VTDYDRTHTKTAQRETDESPLGPTLFRDVDGSGEEVRHPGTVDLSLSPVGALRRRLSTGTNGTGSAEHLPLAAGDDESRDDVGNSDDMPIVVPEAISAVGFEGKPPK